MQAILQEIVRLSYEGLLAWLVWVSWTSRGEDGSGIRKARGNVRSAEPRMGAMKGQTSDGQSKRGGSRKVSWGDPGQSVQTAIAVRTENACTMG